MPGRKTIRPGRGFPTAFRRQGATAPLKVSKKEKKENMGYFHALKLAFLSSLIRKYMPWEGFYHDFSTKKVSASGGFAPWPPPRGSAPWTPEVTSPPLTIYPGVWCVWEEWCVCGDSLERGRSEESSSSGVARPPGEPKWGQKWGEFKEK